MQTSSILGVCHSGLGRKYCSFSEIPVQLDWAVVQDVDVVTVCDWYSTCGKIDGFCAQPEKAKDGQGSEQEGQNRVPKE